jgi:uncharacterized protein (TIGR02246 family)
MSNGPSESVHQLLREASESGDLAHLMSIYADDAVMMPPNDTTLFGREEIAEWYKEYIQWFLLKSTTETDPDLTVAGNQAFHRASVSIVIVPKKKGEPIKDEARVLMVWRREADGAWKITHQIWNSMQPVGSGTNRYISKMIQRKGTK